MKPNDYEFDSVYEVRDGQTFARLDLHAPSLYDGEVGGPWELMNGYSGQDRYAGPIMHPSEFIGGRLERDILENDGVYVSLVNYYTPEDADDDDNVDGWAVARMVDPS